MNTPTPTPNPTPAATPEQRAAAIVTAAQLLDPSDDAHWTKAGEPDLNVMKEMIGYRVTREEVKAAAPDAVRYPAPPAEGQGDTGNDTSTPTGDTGAPVSDNAPATPALTPDAVADHPAPKAEAPAPTPAPVAPKPAPKAENTGELTTFKNVTPFNYKIGELSMNVGESVTVNLALLPEKTRAKLLHGVKVGSFEKVK